jgi:nucleolar pre-ribosomal-associated protein 1
MCYLYTCSAVDKATRIATAFEVVDWVRLAATYSLSEIKTSAEIVTRFHLPALKDLAESLDPEQKLLWDGLNINQDFPHLRSQSVPLRILL